MAQENLPVKKDGIPPKNEWCLFRMHHISPIFLNSEWMNPPPLYLNRNVIFFFLASFVTVAHRKRTVPFISDRSWPFVWNSFFERVQYQVSWPLKSPISDWWLDINWKYLELKLKISKWEPSIAFTHSKKIIVVGENLTNKRSHSSKTTVTGCNRDNSPSILAIK